MEIFRSFTETDLSQYASYEDQQKLKQLLVQTFLLENKSQLTLAHGAEDVLVKSLSWLKSKYDSVLVEDFCWTNYLHIAEGLDFKINKIQSEQNSESFFFNFDSLKKKMIEFPNSIVLLTSPNNPTGHSVDLNKLIALIEEFPRQYFLLDMVYAPLFSLPCVNLFKYKNVTVIGSFSKFFGMPGLRIGFAIGNLPSAFQLNLGMQKNTILACFQALKQIDWYQKNRDEMLDYSKKVFQIKRKNIQLYRSDAPFFLAKLLKFNNLDATFQKAEYFSGVRPKYISKNDIPYIRFGLGPVSICNKIDTYLSFFD